MKASENYLQNGSYPLFIINIETVTWKLIKNIVIWSLLVVIMAAVEVGYVLYRSEASKVILFSENITNTYLNLCVFFYFGPNFISDMMPSIF